MTEQTTTDTEVVTWTDQLGNVCRGSRHGSAYRAHVGAYLAAERTYKAHLAAATADSTPSSMASVAAPADSASSPTAAADSAGARTPPVAKGRAR
ncbi:MAG: hypothetical protein QM662_13835 [Gordonia sp. (in: high G+C Gram-positive bacteria)]